MKYRKSDRTTLLDYWMILIVGIWFCVVLAHYENPDPEAIDAQQTVEESETWE